MKEMKNKNKVVVCFKTEPILTLLGNTNLFFHNFVNKTLFLRNSIILVIRMHVVITITFIQYC